MNDWLNQASELMDRGGWVMWVLLGLGVWSMALMVERLWFWLRTNHPGNLSKYREVAEHLRAGRSDTATQLVGADRSVYGELVRKMLAHDASDAVVTDVMAQQQRRLQRFMPTLSTVITAAPMLGILGTVVGIISSFEALSTEQLANDINAIGSGIAKALVTTVFGLLVALSVLFPYNAYRAQVDKTLNFAEALVAAARRQPPSDPS